MHEALGSFLISVGVIVTIVLFISYVEPVFRLMRRGPPGQIEDMQREKAKDYPRDAASMSQAQSVARE
jgi:hypothetical protein